MRSQAQNIFVDHTCVLAYIQNYTMNERHKVKRDENGSTVQPQEHLRNTSPPTTLSRFVFVF